MRTSGLINQGFNTVGQREEVMGVVNLTVARRGWVSTESAEDKQTPLNVIIVRYILIQESGEDFRCCLLHAGEGVL